LVQLALEAARLVGSALLGRTRFGEQSFAHGGTPTRGVAGRHRGRLVGAEGRVSFVAVIGLGIAMSELPAEVQLDFRFRLAVLAHVRIDDAADIARTTGVRR
jgi:hypothetical protein